MNNQINERIHVLQNAMKEQGIDLYIVTSSDYHQSEYVGEYFKERAYMTGFTGSAGTAVYTQTEARVWVDGRYFLQGEAQLSGTEYQLMKMKQPGVPTIKDYIKSTLKEGGCIGFDGRTLSTRDGIYYRDLAESVHGSLIYNIDLVGEQWTDRPKMSEEPAFALDLKYTGETTKSKLMRIREAMNQAGADYHVLASLDDICWTLNIRGNDIHYFPLVLAYALITKDIFYLYINEQKLDTSLKEKLAKDGVVLRPYQAIYEDISKLPSDASLLLDPENISFALYHNIPEGVNKTEMANPEILFKAIKNDTEVANIRIAQIKDSVAHVRFMKWVKENVDKELITEQSASDKLDAFREEMGNFIRPSFGPISAYGAHGAIVHYSCTPETNVPLQKGSLYLTDTGAGFYEGSTDITRTYALGDIPQIMKDHFTLVAMSNLRLASTLFTRGTAGRNLYILARQPLWEHGLDYNHGTGHGVGYLLNIHEGPIGFRSSEPFVPGMIVTDEPGLYITGSHGIRLENELLVREGSKTDFGDFLRFETITYVPFDLDAINPDLMDQKDKELLNSYHQKVYEKVSPYLSDEEKEWLQRYTRPIT